MHHNTHLIVRSTVCEGDYFEKQGFIKTCHINNILCMNDKNLSKKLHENFLNVSDDLFFF